MFSKSRRLPALHGENELEHAGLTAAPLIHHVGPPRSARRQRARECTEWGTLHIGENRMIIGLIKRVHLRDELFDIEKSRVHSEKLHTIGRMASPHWYCKTRDRFEMIRPK